MSSIALAFIASGFVCMPVHCAEIFVDGEYVMCCYEGHAIAPVTMCGDGCIRIDLDSEEEILSVWS